MKTLFTFTGGCAAVLFFLLAPVFSHADTILSPSVSLLPQGATCAPVAISSVHPSIYDGELHSFSFTISDASYVALGAQIGTSEIPFNQIARQGTGVPGEIRIIVGTKSTTVSPSLPISVSFLSTKGQGLPVCASTFSFVLSGVSSDAGDGGVGTTASSDTPKPTYTLPKNTVSYPSDFLVASGANRVPAITGTQESAKERSTVFPSIGIPNTSKVISNVTSACDTQRGSNNVWSILLALYALFAAYCALVKPGILKRSAESLAAAIVLPFVGLVLFWYFAVACRAGEWVQLLTPAIALISLAIAFWDDSTTENTRLPL